MTLKPVVILALAGLSASRVSQAEAPPALRVSVNCQSEGEIDVCDFVEGYLGSADGLQLVQRSHADVMLYTNVSVSGTTEILLFSAESLGGQEPSEFELKRSVGSRQDADALQAEVAELTLQALSPYLLQLRPGGLMLSLQEIEESEAPQDPGSPYSFEISLGSNSFLTSGYKDVDIWGGWMLSALHPDHAWKISWNASSGWSRQPPLVIDGTEYSLDSETTTMNTEAGYARDLNSTWSVGGWVGAGMEDPEQRFEKTARVHLGVERNWFPSNDPKNNRFAVAYMLGAQADRYHQLNVYGETGAVFPKQLLLASGSVRKGRMEYAFGVDMISELPNILRQYQLSGWTFGSLYLGDHVDLNILLNLTQQAIPGPAELDQSNYEEITQGSYAEPLEMYGYLSIRVHWDRSNGAIYNRFYSAARQGPLENL